MKILLDWDNTTVNFVELFTAKFAEMFPKKTVPRWTQITSYDLSQTFDISWDYIELIFTQIRSKNFYKAASPIDATFFIWFKKLVEEGHAITICTKNTDDLKPLFEYWLSKYGIADVPFDFVDSMDEKLSREFDVIFDDYPGLINHDFWKSNPARHLVIMDAPWNYQVKPETMNQHRVYNWQSFYDIVHKLAEQEKGMVAYG